MAASDYRCLEIFGNIASIRGYGLRLIGSSRLFAGDVEKLEPAGVLSASKKFNWYLILSVMSVACRRRVLVYVTDVNKNTLHFDCYVHGSFLNTLYEMLCIA